MPISGLKKVLLNKMGNNFGVSLCGETVAFFRKFLFQRDVVFNNAIVHHDHAAGAIAVRVGIFLRRSAVGSPAGMPDAIGAVERLEANNLLEIAQFPFGPAYLQTLAISANSNSR